MQKVQIESFNIIGISVRTTNQNRQAYQDIAALWARFMGEQIAERIPNKIDQSIYCLYTNFESDHTGEYDTVLGCKVSSLFGVPEGMVGINIDNGPFAAITAKGDLTKGLLYETWSNIWDMDLDRSFITDFEVYGEKAMNPQDAEVDVFVALHA
ncbi:MAG: GyrI-like domain-containing protein [Bacteroidota bacterium]